MRAVNEEIFSSVLTSDESGTLLCNGSLRKSAGNMDPIELTA